MQRRMFSREFEAVRLATARGVAVAQAARDLDLMRTCCANGRVSYRPIRSIRFPVMGRLSRSSGRGRLKCSTRRSAQSL